MNDISNLPRGSQARGSEQSAQSVRDPLPLTGVTVIEFCSVAAGPFCGMLLGDMGAEVIKIESPEGDALRQWPPLRGGFSENFASLNRNKSSIALNLKDSASRNLARHLVRSADVVIENNRPGVMHRLGLDYESFVGDQPQLVYCSISAFGQEGPRAQQGGFDLTIQAMSGIMSVTGEPGGGPVKCGVPVSDFSAGLYAAFAIASMLARVRAGGAGGHIDVPMLGTSLSIAALQTSEYFGTGADPKALGSAHPRNAPYQAYRSSDGHFVIAAGNNRLWHAVCDTVGMPNLVDDPRFATTRDRALNQARLAEMLAPFFIQHSTVDLLAMFEAVGVPCAPINSYSQILSDPHVEMQGWVQQMEMPGGMETSTFVSPIKINGIIQPVRRGPPALDADRNAILQRYSQSTSFEP
jgi:crotonobetainyl-CoA:carnitine CoA-transferase CaiB-like acyl-CoA transferase